MAIEKERLVNGLLKGFGAQTSPEHLVSLLSQDVEIVAPETRAKLDLWPAIWALASVLERQLFGRVFIRCGLEKPLLQPSPLGPRCLFVKTRPQVTLSLQLGMSSELEDTSIVADARRGEVAIGQTFGTSGRQATPIDCFVLAGNLGFAAIARLVNVPEHRNDYARPTLTLNYDSDLLQKRLKQLDGLTLVGLGQLGQAYLSLLFFLYEGDLDGRRLALIDDDAFEKENGRTQLLLAEGADWLNSSKVSYVARLVDCWGADVRPFEEKIAWTWRRGSAHPSFALLGLHDLEGRRIACASGFERIIEAGVGTNLLRPRVSWHSMPGDRHTGKLLFAEPAHVERNQDEPSGDWVDALKHSPGGCGWVQFQGIAATAPCLGTAAVAFALAELGSSAEVVSGSALLWSQCIPIHRDARSMPSIKSYRSNGT